MISILGIRVEISTYLPLVISDLVIDYLLNEDITIVCFQSAIFRGDVKEIEYICKKFDIEPEGYYKYSKGKDKHLLTINSSECYKLSIQLNHVELSEFLIDKDLYTFTKSDLSEPSFYSSLLIKQVIARKGLEKVVDKALGDFNLYVALSNIPSISFTKEQIIDHFKKSLCGCESEDLVYYLMNRYPEYKLWSLMTEEDSKDYGRETKRIYNVYSAHGAVEKLRCHYCDETDLSEEGPFQGVCEDHRDEVRGYLKDLQFSSLIPFDDEDLLIDPRRQYLFDKVPDKDGKPKMACGLYNNYTSYSTFSFSPGMREPADKESTIEVEICSWNEKLFINPLNGVLIEKRDNELVVIGQENEAKNGFGQLSDDNRQWAVNNHLRLLDHL